MAYTLSDFVDLTKEQRAILEAFEGDETLCQTFYFTGGTLLKALGIVPRVSKDLDFFTFPSVENRTYLAQHDRIYALLTSIFGNDQIHVTEDAYVHRPSGMIIDLVVEHIPTIDDFIPFGVLQTAGIKDIAAAKASALCSRDEVKDYIDIAFLTKKEKWGLQDLETLAEQKYGLGTITEEKLLAELIAKKEHFTLSGEIFLRDGEKNIAFVESQITSLIEHVSL